MIKIKKINNEIVKAPVFKDKNKKPIKGFDICSELYANIFLCAKKNSGKTSVIKKMVEDFADKTTTIVAFVSTLHKDELWSQIQDYCKKHEINFIGHTEIMEDGVNHVKDLLDALTLEAKREFEKSQKEKVPKIDFIICNEESETDSESDEPKKKKYQVPKYILIFDDISEELRNPAVVGLLKKNRHFKMKTIISSQYVLDLLPSSRKQIDLWLIFRGLSDQKLLEVYKSCDTSLEYSVFSRCYTYATEKPYSFFYANVRKDDYRSNFNQKFCF